MAYLRSGPKDDDEKLFLAKILDTVNACNKYSKNSYTNFIDPSQQMLIKEKILAAHTFFGGYDGAERKILCVALPFAEINLDEFPISVLRVDNLSDFPLTHRDYLGSVLALGLKREKIGDILTDYQGAYIILMKDILAYVMDNLKKIGNKGVNVREVSVKDIVIKSKEVQIKYITSASMRLDAIISSALHISRADALDVISAKRVSVNHKLCEKASYLLNQKDLVSVRGYGRIKIAGIGRLTKKGRINVEIERF